MPVLGKSVAVDGLSLSADKSAPLPMARLPGSQVVLHMLTQASITFITDPGHLVWYGPSMANLQSLCWEVQEPLPA